MLGKVSEVSLYSFGMYEMCVFASLQIECVGGSRPIIDIA